MHGIIEWVKKNKLTAILLVIVAYFIYSSFTNNITSRNVMYGTPALQTGSARSLGFNAPSSAGKMMAVDSIVPPSFESAPNLDVQNRMVIKDSYLSLLVENVTKTQNEIIRKTQEMGGFMVNSNVQNPQEAATASITVRIPSNKLDEALAYFRKLSVKVTSENLNGDDVTDQYVDLKARMATLLKTKTKFDEILDKATQVQDILNVQRELVNLQAQIDSLKGQEDYLTKSAQAAKITIYLSTDELSLPYAPTESWRPNVIFKEAVRSLVSTFRNLGSTAIWLLVYSVIWIPVVIIIYILKKRKASNSRSSPLN